MATIRKVVGQITLKVIVDVESTTYFYLLMPSTAPAPSKPTTSPPPVYSTTGYDGWSETEPGYTSGDTRSLYITVRTTYTDGSFEYTTPSLSSSYEAAKEAYNRAQSALTLAGQINQSIWQQTTPYSASIPAGLYVTEVGETAFKQNPSGGNIVLQSTGVTLRNGATQLASLTGNALNFYNPSTGNAQLTIGANGTLQSGNYIRGNDNKFASSGTRIDLITGEIYTPSFRLSQGLDGVTAGAYVHGTIEALDGRIGTGYKPIGEPETNYWEIGNYTDYNLHETAKIIGHGSSFIQLGDSSTWRLATNRIHTGWHIDGDSWLHFPEYTDGTNTLYWDYGFHTPASKDDKFIYIRTAPNTTALSNLLYDIDDSFTTNYWTYNFYVDGNGNIHAKNFYIGDSDTPIGGGTGTIAEKIINQDSTYGKGSTTQPVYIDSNGRVQVVGWSSETSLTNSNQKIPTSAAVKSFVEGKGYTTNTGTVTSVQVQASDPLQSSTASAQSTSLNTTISFKNQNKNVVLAGPATGSAAAPTFRALAIADIPDLSSLYLTSYTETDPTVPNWAKQSSKPSYSASEVGAVATSAVGAANGVAPLNASSKIDSTYLPSYVDDVIEGYYYNNKFWTTSAHTIEIPGEAGKIYVDLATNKTYRYGSSTFTEISQGSLVTVSRSLTSGTKSATITVDGTSYDLYAPSNTNTTYTLSNALASHKFTSTLTPSSGNATTATQEFAAGGAITLTDDTTNKKITIAHTDTSSQASSSNSGRTYIQSVTLDTYGHVTGLSTATETVTDTHYTTHLYVGKSDSTGNVATATTDDTYLRLFDNTTARESHKISGSNGLTISSTSGGDITFASPITFTDASVVTVSGKNYIRFTKSDGNTKDLNIEDITIIQAQGATKLVGTDASATPLTVAGPVQFTNGIPVSMKPASSSGLFLKDDGTWATPGGTYSLPLAANGTRGGVQIGYTQSGKNYPVQLSSEKMYVNVPWENTTYSAGTGLSLSGTTFNHSNVLNSAQTTQAIYPIKIDKYGHISAYGTAVTIPDISGKVNITETASETTTNIVRENGGIELQAFGGNDWTTIGIYPGIISLETEIDSGGYPGIYLTKTNREINFHGGTIKYLPTGSSYSYTITGTATAERTLTLPNKTGTVALTSDVIDTKNTAGSTDSNSKLFLIGATSQAANPQTYSHDTAYVGTDGCLYSNNNKVLVEKYGTDSTGILVTPYAGEYGSIFSIFCNRNDDNENVHSAMQLTISDSDFNITDINTEKAYITVYSRSLYPNGNVFITGLPTPTQNDQAVNKAYVDSSIPTVNNATLTIQKNGTTVKTFTANASSNVTANIVVPTKISDLTNDSNFVTLNTSQTLTAAGLKKFLGLQIFGTDGISFGTNSNSDITAKVNMKYNSTLDALTFTFV